MTHVYLEVEKQQTWMEPDHYNMGHVLHYGHFQHFLKRWFSILIYYCGSLLYILMSFTLY